MLRIRVIAPVTNQGVISPTLEVYAQKAREDTHISAVSLDKGPLSIECLYEDAVAVPEEITRAIEAERDGVDAVIIDCMNDPGLEAAREVVRIPVIGAAQSAMLMASLLAHRFSIIGTDRRDVFPNERLVRRYGLTRKYASTRSVDIPVGGLDQNDPVLLDKLVEQSTLAVNADGAHAIIFGCTGMKGMAARVEDRLRENGVNTIVIDPSLAALKWAEMLVSLKLSQSLRTYPHLTSEKLLSEHQEKIDIAHPETRGQLTSPAHIHVAVPVSQGYRPDDWLEACRRDYAAYARADTLLTLSAIETGPVTIETQYYKHMAVPEMLRLVRQAEQDQSTAVLIDCMSDPGLDPMREAASIPVLGPAHTCAWVASSLGHSFSILGTLSEMGHKFISQMNEYGTHGKLASVRTTGLSVQEVESDPDRLSEALLREGQTAVEQDGAHVLIPGCTGMIGIASELQNSLAKRGINVPVLEPPAVAVKMGEALSDLGLTHSKLTYPNPPTKKLPGFPELEIQKGA
jgi:allantoin racemase